MPSGDVAASHDEAYVNHLDIKLHEVFNLPPEWYESPAPAAAAASGAGASNNTNNNNNKDAASTVSVAGAAPAYNLHPFRYDVTVQWPSSGALTADPAQADKSTTSVAEPSAASVSAADSKKSRKATAAAAAPATTSTSELSAMEAAADASTGPHHTTAAEAASGSTLQAVPLFRFGRLLAPLAAYMRYVDHAMPAAGGCAGEEVRPLRDVPAAVEEAVVAAAKEDALDGGAALADDEDGASSPAPVLLWVCTAATSVVHDPSPNAHGAESAAGRRRLKKAGAAAAGGAAGGGAGGAGQGLAASGGAASDAFAAAPPLPDAQAVPPCVVRLPLTAAVEQHLQRLIRTGEPLVLTVHRTLKPNAPPEWEDLCAAYYTADIRIPLTALADPGATRAQLRVPLTPASAQDGPASRADVTPGEGTLSSTTGFASGSSAPAAGTAAAAAAQDQRRKKATARKAVKANGMPAILCELPDVSQPHPYVRAGTSALVSLCVAQTLTRLPQDRVRPGVVPTQLLPTRAAADAHSTAVREAATLLDGGMGPVSDALESIAQQLFAEFAQFAQQQQQQHQRGSGDASGGAVANTRAHFMSFVQSTGRLAAYKQQLVPLVARMARQARAHGAASAGTATDVDVVQLTSNLYVALLERTHQILRTVADTNRTTPSPDHTTTASMHHSPIHATEDAASAPVLDAWHRRAAEAELVDDFATAEGCLQARLSQARSGPPPSHAAMADGTHSDPAVLGELWTDLADLYCRWEHGHAHKAEASYREALSHAPAHVRALLNYGLFLLARHRHEEAEVYLQCAVDVQPTSETTTLAWACVCVMFDVRQLERATAGSADAGTAETERLYALRKAHEARQGDAAPAPPHHSPVGELTDLSLARTYLEVAQYALRLHHRGLAALALSRTTTTTTTTDGAESGSPAPSWQAYAERLYAHLFLQGGQYTEARRALGQCRRAVSTAHASRLWAEADVLEAELVVLEASSALADGVEEGAASSLTALRSALCLANAGHRTDSSDAEADPGRATRLAGPATATNGRPPSEAAGAVDGLPPLLEPCWWLESYVRLSNLLMRRSRYRDALGVLVIALARWPETALLWSASGTAYLRLGDYTAAEACLGEASRLDCWNPRTWALLALVHLYANGSAGRQGGTAPGAVVGAAVQQAHQHGLVDASLEAELGRVLLSAGYVELAELCLRRALQLLRDSSGGQDGMRSPSQTDTATLVASTRYRLAHALMAAGKAHAEALALLQAVHAETAAPAALRAKAQDDQQRMGLLV